MSETIRISEGILNGVRSLTDEASGSSQSEATLADQKRITALARGNSRTCRGVLLVARWRDPACAIVGVRHHAFELAAARCVAV